jgi:hypothetical protein
MIKLTATLTALFIMIIACSGLAEGASVALDLHDGQKEYDPIPYIFMLEDHDKMAISDIIQPAAQARFEGPPSAIPNYGYSASVQWVRLPIHNSSSQKEWLFTVKYPSLDHVDLYIKQSSGSLVQKQAGDALPFKNRDVFNRQLTFSMEIEPGQSAMVYMRVETEGAMALPIKIYHPVGYAEYGQSSYMGLGCYFGMLIILIIYNGVLSFSLRSRAFFYYVGINASVLFLYGTLNGLTYQYIWPEAVWWNNRAIVFFICLSHAATLMFTRSFLDGKMNFPRLHKVFAYFAALELLNIAVLFFSYPIGLRM